MQIDKKYRTLLNFETYKIETDAILLFIATSHVKHTLFGSGLSVGFDVIMTYVKVTDFFIGIEIKM